MGKKIARQGDRDDKGFVITNNCSPDVRINGKPVALKGSKMNDNVSIVDGFIPNFTINGKPVAAQGSKTDPHPRSGRGTIINGSPDVGGE
jgi:uncharacterized Zn-binding protein involved in type VI secretion